MSDVIHKIEGYDTSRDYAALADLMRRQSVVCIVDYGRGKPFSYGQDCRDVAHTIWSPSRIGCRECKMCGLHQSQYATEWK